MLLERGHIVVNCKGGCYLIQYFIVHLANNWQADIRAENVAEISGVGGYEAVTKLWERHHSFVKCACSDCFWPYGKRIFRICAILCTKHIFEHVPGNVM